MYRIIYLLFLALLLIPVGTASAVLPDGWASQDIGTPTIAGSADQAAGTWTVNGNGGDIWNNSDSFHYCYTATTGNCEISARVVSLGGGTSTWQKAGVMIRETLDGGSTHAFMAVTTSGGGGSSFQGRTATGGGSVNNDYTAPTPYYVRVIRSGDNFTGSASPDGVVWTDIASRATVMTPDVYVGFAVTSHDDAEPAALLSTGIFDDALLNGIPPGTCGAWAPDPPSASFVAPEYWEDNVYMLLDYSPGTCAEGYWCQGYLSDNKADVDGRNPANSLGTVPPWPSVSETAWVVGYDDPAIVEFARAPLVPGTTYYWCVDSWDGTEYWPSSTWSFTPIPVNTWGPDPYDGEGLVAPDGTMTWQLGTVDTSGLTLTYDVYTGTDWDDVNDADTTSPEYVANVGTEAYDYAGLDSETEYFWRVDTKLCATRPPFPCTITKGDVWSFTTGPPGIGGILREWWDGIGGVAIPDLTNDPRYPSSPDGSEIVTLFEGPTDTADNYGSRLHGWLYVQNAGDYTFWIATDDAGELWLSTDMNPANASLIAYVTGWVPSRNFDGTAGVPGPGQMSAPIHLEADNMYYISGLMKEGGGGDNIAAAWEGPDSGGVREVIPGGHLVPFMPVTASNPDPPDRSPDAPLNVTLSWTAGIDQSTDSPYATQHVYVGSDPVTVANADTTSPEYMVSGPTGPNEYGPLSLSYYDQVYWRIDGVVASSGAVDYPGAVWTFQALPDPLQIPDANLKLWLKFENDVLDSSGHGRHGTEYGGPTYVSGSDGQAIHLDGVDDWVDIEYGVGVSGADPRTIAGWAKATTTAIPVWTNVFGFSSASVNGEHFDIEIVGDTDATTPGYYGLHMHGDEYDILPPDIEWHHLAATYDGTTLNLYGDAVPMGSVVPTVTINTNDKVRIGCRLDNTNYFPGSVDDVRIYDVVKNAAQIAEIMRIDLSWAWNPAPMHGAVDVPRDQVLSWSPGDGATAHTVWFGADNPSNMVQVAGPQVGTTYDPPGDLALGTTYYWSVVESPGGVMGHTWKFSTSNYLVLDDMEAYVIWSNPAGPHIFVAWRDGFGDCTPGNGNDTGSVLTENPSPVLAGIQSMKYDFDNDGIVYSPCTMGNVTGRTKYSRIEAQTATLGSGIGSDWTLGGVKALYVPFHGQAGNATTESLWVQLQDGDKGYGPKVFYGTFEGESLDDFNEPSWHDWYIDLADFDVDLTNVVSIVIGIGDESKATAYGSGTLFFDEMRLYAPTCVPSRSSAAFALVDYAPEGNRDCVVDYKELAVMTRDWLQSDMTINPEALSPGPVAWYNFENNVLDSTANGNHGTAEVNPTYTVSRPGLNMAIDCNGTGDYVSTGKTAADLGIDGNNPRTITAWVYVRAFNDGAIFDMGNRANGEDFSLRTLATDNSWRIQYWGGDVTETGWSTGDFDFTYPSLNEWVHFAHIHDGTYTKVYANGLKIVDVPRTLNTSSANAFVIASYGFPEFTMDARIDDFRLFDYGLSHGQVLTTAGIGAPMYVPVTSPANLTDPEGVNNLKVNFKDYSVLLDSWGDTEEWPAW